MTTPRSKKLKEEDLTSPFVLACCEAQGYVLKVAEGEPVKVVFRRQLISSITKIEHFKIDLDNLPDGISAAELEDAENGEFLLLIHFDREFSNVYEPSELILIDTPFKLNEEGKPLHILPLVGGKGRHYKRKTQSIVTIGGTVIDIHLISIG